MKCELYHDNFQNFKKYGIPKAQLVIADIPYNIGADAYGSNPTWYIGGDNKNGESKKAKSSFFNSDGYFKIAEYMHFCNRLLKKEPKEKGQAPAMLVFCAFDQMQTVMEYGKQYGFKNSYPMFFCKNYSAQVLKANMRVVGATEFAVVLYRDKLPKFNNGREIGEDGKPIRGTGKMVFDWQKWERDGKDIPATESAVCNDVFLGEFTLTAYCPGRCCCGKWASGYTATGTLAAEGRTIAVDPEVIPYGTRVLLIWPNGTQRSYIAEDCGGGVNGNHIDVFFNDHQAARVFGVQSAMVYMEVEE